MLTRRGFTLIELMVAVTLLAIVSIGIYRVLVNNQRIYQAQTQRIDLQQNIRAAVTILPAELRELDAVDGDILAMGATSMTVRGTRQLAFICTVPVVGAPAPVMGGQLASLNFTIRNDPFYSVRDFDATTDSIFVYYEGDQASTLDDGWVQGSLTSAANGGVCVDGQPGRNVTATVIFRPGQVALTGRIQNGSPIRGYEPVTYSLYQASDSRWYLGYQSLAGGNVRQPLIGPVQSNGVQFDFFNVNNVATAVPAEVATIRITLRAQTAAPVRSTQGGQQYVTDSVITTVGLRNNRRWAGNAPGS